MPRSYAIVAPTRPDVFIRLHTEVWRRERGAAVRLMWRRLLWITGTVIPGLFAADLLGYRLTRDADAATPAFLYELIPLIAVVFLLISGLEAWTQRRRYEHHIRGLAAGDLKDYDYELRFDEERLWMTCSKYTLEFRRASAQACEVLPRTVYVTTPIGAELMFAEEYLGAEAFAALADLVREKVPMRT